MYIKWKFTYILNHKNEKFFMVKEKKKPKKKTMDN